MRALEELRLGGDRLPAVFAQGRKWWLIAREE
jgi:hypothetical protein